MLDIPQHLLPARIDRSEYAVAHYTLWAPQGISPDAITDPDFWVHLASRLRIGDRIEVIARDGTFDADLRVIALDPRGLWAQVRVLRMQRTEAAVMPAGQYPDKDGYVVDYDAVRRWFIARGTDIVARDFPDEAGAVSALANLKAVAPKRKAA